MFATCIGLLWGLLQGARHAIEPDHLAAVSTLVAERRSARSAASYAAAWGLGHALVLLAVGGALLVLRARLSQRVAASFELIVAAMLIVLGVRALARASAARLPGHRAPAAPGSAHVHGHAAGRAARARQPLLVGCVHGLAGSGALAAMVAAQMHSAAAGLVYMMVYGVGAALGMAALAGVAGVPLARVMRTERGRPVLLATTGALSLMLGVTWGWTAAGPALVP